jgi:sensor histidine kinase YesM
MLRVKEVYIRWFGIPILAFLIKFLNKHEGEDMLPFWVDYFISLVFTGIYWNVCYGIFILYRRKFPKIDQTFHRLVMTIFTMVILTIVINPMIRLSFDLITFSDLKDPNVLFEFVPLVIFVSFTIGSFYESVYFFEKYKASIKHNEELKSQQIKTRFEVLQNQMSPHFLFNSLNTLTTLILEDQKIAYDFTEKLSDVYRYILQTKNKEIITLKEELEFVKDYLFLLQMRYPKNLHISFNINDQVLDWNLPPLTLQILVENCVKHNVVSNSHPLFIEIYTNSDNCLLVKNEIREKASLDESTKTGLDNIRKRYQLLIEKDIDIIRTERNFIVSVPLIQMHTENQSKNLETLDQ